MRLLLLKMRRWRNTDMANTIIAFVRLLPFVIVIGTLKVFIILIMMHSSSSGDVTSDDYGTADDGEDDVTMKNPYSQVTFSSSDLQKFRVLAQLNDTVLVATATNRTPDTIWLFYNRIPRTGGSTLVSLLQELALDWDYQHQTHVYRTPWQRLLTADEQKNLATWFEYNFWPKSYDRYALYINFTERRSPYVTMVPAYITMVRDPLEKFISTFRFKRSDPDRSKVEMGIREKKERGAGRKWYWRTVKECVLQEDPECSFKEGSFDFVSAIPFLCGQNETCMKNNDKWALQKAKFHAEFEYSVVGILERFNETMAALEYYIPMFFAGARQRYWSKEFEKHRHQAKTVKKFKPPPDEVLQILKNKLALEYELYEFLNQRLQRQLEALGDKIHSTTPLPPRVETPAPLGAWDRFNIELRRTP